MPDQVWLRSHVLTILKRVALAGEGLVTVDKVQELAGVGPADASVTLGLLVDEGSVVESGEGFAVAPHVLEGNGAEPAQQQTTYGDGDPLDPATPMAGRREDGGQAGLSPDVLEAAAELIKAGSTPPPGAPANSGPRRVSLPAAVVAVLQPEQIGAMVLAGMVDAQEAGATFELIVTTS